MKQLFWVNIILIIIHATFLYTIIIHKKDLLILPYVIFSKINGLTLLNLPFFIFIFYFFEKIQIKKILLLLLLFNFIFLYIICWIILLYITSIGFNIYGY